MVIKVIVCNIYLGFLRTPPLKLNENTAVPVTHALNAALSNFTVLIGLLRAFCLNGMLKHTAPVIGVTTYTFVSSTQILASTGHSLCITASKFLIYLRFPLFPSCNS